MKRPGQRASMPPICPETIRRGSRPSVPGTAAGASGSSAEWRWGDEDQAPFDGSEWWYRCRFDAPEGSARVPGAWSSTDWPPLPMPGSTVNASSIPRTCGSPTRSGSTSLGPQNTLLLRFAALEPRCWPNAGLGPVGEACSFVPRTNAGTAQHCSAGSRGGHRVGHPWGHGARFICAPQTAGPSWLSATCRRVVTGPTESSRVRLRLEGVEAGRRRRTSCGGSPIDNHRHRGRR